MKKIKTWWSEDGKWFCLFVDDGVSKATVSLSREEFAEFSKEIAAAHVAGIGEA